MPQFTHGIAALTSSNSSAVDPNKTYYFQTINGVIHTTQRVAAPIELPGRRGHGIQLHGLLAPESQLESLEFCESLAAATFRLAAYKALIEQAAYGVRVIQSGLDYYPADVLGVSYAVPPQLTDASTVVGSIVANPNAILRCVWRVKMRDLT